MVPEWLEWTDVVLSVIAFGVGFVTLPTAFQMWWGKPRLRFEFDRSRVRGGVGLIFWITNEPVRNRLLKWVGVTRDAAQKVRMTVTIRENGTKRFIASGKTTIKVENDESLYSVDLYSNTRSWAIIITQGDGAASGEINAPGNKDGKLDIQPGEYECTLSVKWGQGSASETRIFYVNPNVEATQWQEPTDV